MSKVVAIVSGGMDSTTLLYRLRGRDDDVTCVSFNYGQKHQKEINYARSIATKLQYEHVVIDLFSLTEHLQSSALVGDHPVPEGHYAEDNMARTVVPNRNMMMLSIAGAIAVDRRAVMLATGVHAGDHYQYPDCRTEFLYSFEGTLKLANLGFITEDFVVYAPFKYMTKADIAYDAIGAGIKFEDTWSCYKGGAIHCGRCGTCVERLEAIDAATAKWNKCHPGYESYQTFDDTRYIDSTYWKEAVRRYPAV